MESALEMEKEGNVALIALRNMADDHKDYDVRNHSQHRISTPYHTTNSLYTVVC